MSPLCAIRASSGRLGAIHDDAVKKNTKHAKYCKRIYTIRPLPLTQTGTQNTHTRNQTHNIRNGGHTTHVTLTHEPPARALVAWHFHIYRHTRICRVSSCCPRPMHEWGANEVLRTTHAQDGRNREANHSTMMMDLWFVRCRA